MLVIPSTATRKLPKLEQPELLWPLSSTEHEASHVVDVTDLVRRAEFVKAFRLQLLDWVPPQLQVCTRGIRPARRRKSLDAKNVLLAGNDDLDLDPNHCRMKEVLVKCRQIILPVCYLVSSTAMPLFTTVKVFQTTDVQSANKDITLIKKPWFLLLPLLVPCMALKILPERDDEEVAHPAPTARHDVVDVIGEERARVVAGAEAEISSLLVQLLPQAQGPSLLLSMKSESRGKRKSVNASVSNV